jgi:hypothetical protein
MKPRALARRGSKKHCKVDIALMFKLGKVQKQ